MGLSILKPCIMKLLVCDDLPFSLPSCHYLPGSPCGLTFFQTGVDEERVVKQFQFANWSDHDCPNPSSVLEYRRRVKTFAKGKPGPIVVHCRWVTGQLLDELYNMTHATHRHTHTHTQLTTDTPPPNTHTPVHSPTTQHTQHIYNTHIHHTHAPIWLKWMNDNNSLASPT